MSKEKLKIAVLISGSGTNLKNIIEKTKSNELSAKVVLVISSNSEAGGLKIAQAEGIPNFTCPSGDSRQILELLTKYETGLVVMAGYMRLLPKEILQAFPNAVMNIHPSLLPAFAGGHAIEKSFEKGIKVAGPTVHFANEIFDEGPIILQKCFDVSNDETIESFELKIHQIEYEIYPKAIQLFAENRLKINNGKVEISNG